MANRDQDPYQILGVTKSSTHDEIKNAYRTLAKKFHPDLNPGNKAAEDKFKRISQAYDLIGTPEARGNYDRREFERPGPGEGPFRQERPFYYRTQQDGPEGGRYAYSFGEEMDQGDLFETLFGERFTGFGQDSRSRESIKSPLKGEDLHHRMDIRLDESIQGGAKDITFPSGHPPGQAIRKKLRVKLPKGVTDGTRLKFAGQGKPGLRGGPPGDAYVEIHVLPDPRFQREGDDLILQLPVSITEALFGGEIQIPTIEKELVLRIPPHSNTGTRLRLRGLGAWNRSTGKRGDLLVNLNVLLPKTVDSELESTLRKWQEQHSYNPREKAAA